MQDLKIFKSLKSTRKKYWRIILWSQGWVWLIQRDIKSRDYIEKNFNVITENNKAQGHQSV